MSKQHNRNLKLGLFSGFVTAALFLICHPPVAHAQITSLLEPTLAIVLEPAYPAPGESFTASINSYSLTGRTITWAVDGDARPEATDKRAIELVAPEEGVVFRIRATIAEGSRNPIVLNRVLVPGNVDVVVEAETVVPPFYKGMPLPGTGSEVRVIALPRLYNTAGALLDSDSLTYQWRVGNRTALSGVGEQALTTTIGRSDTFISLVIKNGSGEVMYEETRVVTPFDPVVLFYEQSPLYGLSHTMVSSLNVTTGEVGVRAVPYYTSTNIFDNAQVQWTLNGAPITNPSASPDVITLRRTGSGGVAEVGFSIRNLDNLLQHGTGLFNVVFNEPQ